MSLTARVAYLKGLAEGSGLTSDDKQGKFYQELLDCLEEISVAVDFLDKDHDELEEYLETIDEDLNDLEDYIYENEDEYDDFDDFDDDFDLVEANCPACGETISYFDDLYDEAVDIICPYCDAVVTTIGDPEADEETIENKE